MQAVPRFFDFRESRPIPQAGISGSPLSLSAGHAHFQRCRKSVTVVKMTADEIARLAMAKDPGEREGLVKALCGEDRSLLEEVELRLLFPSEVDQMAGRRIGPYQIIRRIGGGGMGAVYLAVRADEHYQKRVAVKLLHRGVADEEMISRFRHERQTLAALDHPNIVRLIDGGSTEDGLPYLVMDYVDGIPLIEYANARRLGLRQRLEIFRSICGAVHYAHQNLVIHRDLKPANIMVTADGTPKLMDFGVARLLASGDEQALAGTAGRRTMTLRYASPEQVRFTQITVATDIYSLGVVLYDLVAGRMPYVLQEEHALAMAYAICEQEPMPPSLAVTAQAAAAQNEPLAALKKRLAGDIDAIAVKCMRKSPADRYASVEQLSDDIRRHFENLPVLAHRSTIDYRLRKLIARNKLAAAGAAAALLLVIAGILGIAWEARRADSERRLAERRFADVRELANSFLFEFHDAISDLPGSTPARLLLVRKASEYLDKLARDAGNDLSLQVELSEAYGKLGDVQGNPYAPNLGDPQGALASYRKALDIAQAAERSHPKDARARRALAGAFQQAAEVMPMLGNLEESAAHRKKAVAIFEQLARESGTAARRIDLARAYDSLADVLGHPGLPNLGDSEGALSTYGKSLSEWDAALSMDRKNPVSRRGVAIMNMKIADMLANRGQLSEALDMYRRSREGMEALSAANPGNTTAQRNLSVIFRKLASAQADAGDSRSALDNYRAASSISESLAAADPNNAQARADLMLTWKRTGDLYYQTGNAASAMESYGKAIDSVEAMLRVAPENMEKRGQYADLLVLAGDLLVRSGQAGEGKRQTQRGLAMMKQLTERAEASPDDLQRYAEALTTAQPPDLRDAALAVQFAEQSASRTKYSDPDKLRTLAEAYFLAGNTPQAIQIGEKAMSLLPAPRPGQPSGALRRVIEQNVGKYRADKGTALQGDKGTAARERRSEGARE